VKAHLDELTEQLGELEHAFQERRRGGERKREKREGREREEERAQDEVQERQE